MRKVMKTLSSLNSAVLAFTYLLATLLIFGYAARNRRSVVRGFESGRLENRHLTLEDFDAVEAEVLDSMSMINASSDTQIIFSGEVRNVYITCTFSADPGEFVAFYNKTGDGAWSESRERWARLEDGSYCFEFPQGTKQIRIDTGVEPSIRVDFEDIEINRKTPKLLWGPLAGELFTLAVAPAALVSVRGIIAEAGRMLMNRKETENEEI